MGKSSKKSDAKVAAAAPGPAVKPAKNGKRDAEEALKKLASAKKQKTEVKVEKKKAPPPKKVDTSSSEDDLSESEEEVKVPTKKDNKQAKTLANESSSSEESSSDEEIDAKASVLSKKLPATGAKNGAALVSKKKNESSDSSDSDSSSDDEPSSKKKPSLPVAKKQPESSDSSSGSDSSGDEEAVVAKPSATVKPTVATSNVVPSSGLKKNESSDSESDDSSKDESDVKKVPVSVTPSKPNAKAVKKESSSDEDESEDEEDSSDDEPPKTQKNAMDTDVKMKDAQSEKKEPTTPSQIQPSGSKTLFVGNLSYDVDDDQISEFFEKAGEIVGVRLAKGEDGRFRGFGHVEFVTETAAQKAMEMNGETLLGRAVRLDLARERGAYTPQSGRESNSYQKGGQRQGQTIFVKGFDKSLGEDEVRSSLQDHFGSCGQISRLSIPPDHETGAPKGIAYIDFKDQDGASQALELNGSDLGGYTLTVDEAKPRGDSRDGGYSGGRGGRDSGGRGGRFGGRGRGRDGGGRGGRGRGGRGGRGRGGRGGRGTPNRQSFSAASAGKKTTFADD